MAKTRARRPRRFAAQQISLRTSTTTPSGPRPSVRATGRTLVTPMNKRLFTLWMSLTLLLFSSSLFAQNFSAQLDRDHIGIQETFTLTLRYQGSTNESPNLDVLNREFELISVHSGDYTQIINNQVNSFIEWRLTLAPR